MNRQNGPVRIEPHLWRHSIESSLLAFALTIILAAVLPHFRVALWLIAVSGVTLTAIVFWTALMSTRTLAVPVYLAAWGVVITGWLSATHFLGIEHTAVMAGLIVPFIILAPLGAVAVGHHRDVLRQAADAEAQRKNDRELRGWERRLALHGVPGVTITDVVKHGTGKVIQGRLGKAKEGQSAITMDRLRGIAETLAVDLRLAPDAVMFERPENGSAADFVMHVRERERKEGPVFLPAANHPLTISRPFPVGIRQDGRDYEMLLREVCVMIAGVRGAGKSNLLNVCVAQLARCVDVVMFMIDTKGGRTARPWMTPWIQGHCSLPVLDWVATDKDEAALMMQSLLDGVRARAKSGGDGAGGTGEKIEPSIDTPAVILICDEVAFVFGDGGGKAEGISNYKLAKFAADYVGLGRSEAMDAVFATLRGTTDATGNTFIKAMCQLRVGMAVTSTTDAGYIFPDDNRAAAALTRITRKGSGLVLDLVNGHRISPRVDFFRITDGSKGTEDRITPIATVTGDEIRPALDDLTAAAMGDAYATRWTRPHGAELKKAWAGEAGMIRLPDDIDPEFGDIIAQMEDPEAEIDIRRKRMREILIGRRYAGATTGVLVRALQREGLTPRREVLQRWLKADMEQGLVRKGSQSRWIWVFAEQEEKLGESG